MWLKRCETSHGHDGDIGSFIGTQIDVCANAFVSGKALAAGLLNTPAASLDYSWQENDC
jgi:hypothetical protein